MVNFPTRKNSLIYFIYYLFIYEFLSRIAFSVLKVNCYQWGSCVGGPSAFNFPFGHRSHSHSICPLDNHLSGLSISLSSLVLSWVYRLPFFKSLVWLLFLFSFLTDQAYLLTVNQFLVLRTMTLSPLQTLIVIYSDLNQYKGKYSAGMKLTLKQCASTPKSNYKHFVMLRLPTVQSMNDLCIKLKSTIQKSQETFVPSKTTFLSLVSYSFNFWY